MITRAELHANFKISPRAMDVIHTIAEQVAREDGETPEALVIHWGTVTYHDGRKAPYGVFFGFYNRQLFSQLKAGDWTIINGMKVVFFVIERDFENFFGKTLDIDGEGRFFLNE